MMMEAEGPKGVAQILAMDVGNTRVAVGVVRGEQAYVMEKVPAAEVQGVRPLLRQMWEGMGRPRRVVACSVNPPLLVELAELVQDELDESVVVVGRDIPLPLATMHEAPECIGTDRLCCAAAAYERLQQACVVVDMGTAITIDCVDGDGVFLGGAILPGMRMQAEALHRGTAQLPEVELAAPEWVFGRSTRESVLSGIVQGARGAIRGLVEAYATELGQWPLVICTGGDAELLGPCDELVQARVEPLCLLGVARAFYKSLGTAESDGA